MINRSPNVNTGMKKAARKPRVIRRWKKKRQPSRSGIQKLIRCVILLPLCYLLLERALLFPFEDSALSGYLDVEHIAVTTTIKKKKVKKAPAAPAVRPPIFDTPRKSRKSLEALTQPFRVTDTTSSLRCPTNSTKIAGYRHLGDDVTPEASPTNLQQKIPKLLHQQGPSRCVSSTLYDLNEFWVTHLEVDKDDGREWSIFFHTEDAMTRLFRASIAVQGEKKYPKHLNLSRIGKEFPQLGQILRNCVDHGSFSRRILWRFLCLYAYGGMYIDLEYILPLTFDDIAKSILRDSYDTVLLWAKIEGNLQNLNESENKMSQSRVQLNPNIMAVTPGHPLMYYAVQHLLIAVITDGFLGEDGDIEFNKSSQDTAVSNILKRALNDFYQDQSLDTGTAHHDVKHSNSRVKTFPGTGNTTVTILDASEGGFSHGSELMNEKFLSLEQSEFVGKKGSSLDKSRGGKNDKKKMSSSSSASSCLLKSLADASTSS